MVRHSALLGLFGLAIIYTLLTFGEASVTTDGGRWHAEIEAFAQGHTLYRDYNWPFPPLSMWLLGSWALVFGAGSLSLVVATTAVFFAIVMVWYMYVRAVARDVPAVFWPAAFILAVGAAYGSIPVGMYTPAAPIGFLFTLAALTILVARSDTSWGPYAAGVLCGLAILTKQDFWPSALFMLVAGGLWLYRWPGRGRLWASALLTVFAGALVIALTAGVGTLPEVAVGFGRLDRGIDRQIPSWRIMTTELAVLGLLCAASVICLRFVGLRRNLAFAAFPAIALAALAVHFTATFQGWGIDVDAMRQFHLANGSSLFRPALGWFTADALRRPIPVILPFTVLLILLWKWREIKDRDGAALALFLVGLAAASRARRGFEYTEWWHIFIELPAYVLVLRVLASARINRIIAALSLLLLIVGVQSYQAHAAGPFTNSRPREWLETARGPIRLSESSAAGFREVRAVVDSLDPTGERPVFVLAKSGGYNYYMGRRNPALAFHGFIGSGFPPEEVQRRILESDPPTLLIDRTAAYDWQRFEHSWEAWEPVPVPTVFDDRVWFDRTKALCQEVARATNHVIYDCAGAGSGSTYPAGR
ncbi:MAG TPA: hypothetical protein VMM79_05465 [Longimicrobiales bacterium]|nr:hypothetical protein [Longimicrobiales bacterium]